MEGIGSEVSHKIRAAIKAKLIELGAYVDDELPDYIMVMVANKRTRSQMDEDLQLFLTSNTKIFTSWLHTVLQKLQEVTVANFESKRELDNKKASKRKRSELDDETSKSRKSSEEVMGKTKKHAKKHKETKKSKKNKHKNKEKSKLKSAKKEDKGGSKDKTGKEDGKEETKTSQDAEKSLVKKIKNKLPKSKKMQLNEAVGKAILGDLKKNEKLKNDKNDFSSQSSSSANDLSNVEDKGAKENENNAKNFKLGAIYPDDDVLNIKVDDEPEGMEIVSNKKVGDELIEDDFNIEPLKPAEKSIEMNLMSDNKFKESQKLLEISGDEVQIEKTISAPTEKLLKEHNKIQNQKLEGEEKATEKKNTQSDSEESLSPEEMRKQLLLSRAKKKLEESKLAERMRSNSPDVLILEEPSRSEGIQKDPFPGSRMTLSKQHYKLDSLQTPPPPSGMPSKNSSRSPSSNHCSKKRTPSPHSSDFRKISSNQKSKTVERKTSNSGEKIPVGSAKDKRNSSPVVYDREETNKNCDGGGNRERKKNVIKISESLEMEKNLGVKKDTDSKKSKEKEIAASRRRPVSSRVVTISEPDAPEISSIVKVKPREYISKDKQANKALILKAVADAEKSIATIHNRNESEPEPKKLEALFTKNLRGKRYEKLAVTLSNIRKSPDSHERIERRVSVDSEKSERSRQKQDSSEGSDIGRGRSDIPSKKLSKSDDQFISSKTTVMEKNDKYIRCWLEGVEKAVKEDEMVNPSEMEDFSHSNFTDEENDFRESGLSNEDERKRKRLKTDDKPEENFVKNQKLSEKEIASLRLIPNAVSSDDGPQIVVTLDGLNSKTIKDIILRNREVVNGPILSTSTRKSMEKDKEAKDKSGKWSAGVSKDKSPSTSKNLGFEKISDRFGRLNKTSEDNDSDKGGRGDKRGLKYQSSDKEKKDKSVTESKNRQLIAQLSEKFGKVDREFENKKRKYPDEGRLYSYDSRRSEKEENERNGKYKKSDRRILKEGSDYEDIRRLRSRDRCIFWPGCSKGSSCEYFHPTSPCKLLPNCINKDRCMYVHPFCKNYERCRDRDCPYEHTSSRKSRGASPKENSSKRLPSPQSSKFPSTSSQICKYFPNCKNLDCRYFHPKKCRFDDDCTNPDCKYVHSDTSVKKKPKWYSKS